MKFYNIYKAQYTLPNSPSWAKTKLWVKILDTTDKQYIFLNRQAAQLCINWLKIKYPNKEFKIVESEG